MRQYDQWASNSDLHCVAYAYKPIQREDELLTGDSDDPLIVLRRFHRDRAMERCVRTLRSQADMTQS